MRFLFVVTHVMTAVTFTVQRVGFYEKRKTKNLIYFQFELLECCIFFKSIDNTVFFSINISHLFIFDLYNNVSLLYWQILKLDFQTWVNLNTNFIVISACMCSCRVNKLTSTIYTSRKGNNSVMFALLLIIITLRWVLLCIWIRDSLFYLHRCIEVSITYIASAITTQASYGTHSPWRCSVVGVICWVQWLRTSFVQTPWSFRGLRVWIRSWAYWWLQ